MMAEDCRIHERKPERADIFSILYGVSFSWNRFIKAVSGGSGKKPAAKHDFVLSSGGGMGHHAAAH